jgi:hypothetical protein
MRHWVGVLSEERFATERLYARDAVCLAAGAGDVRAGDPVVLVAAGAPAVLFAHGVVAGHDDGGVRVAYRTLRFDTPVPVPADVLPASASPRLHPVALDRFQRLSALVDASASTPGDRAVWFVSLAVPIEASTPAEAVREFWTYVDTLGPRDLPAYVWPLGDELSMQAFVLGAVTNLDPEEDD